MADLGFMVAPFRCLRAQDTAIRPRGQEAGSATVTCTWVRAPSGMWVITSW